MRGVAMDQSDDQLSSSALGGDLPAEVCPFRVADFVHTLEQLIVIVAHHIAGDVHAPAVLQGVSAEWLPVFKTDARLDALAVPVTPTHDRGNRSFRRSLNPICA
jgi:hypothetical protein